MRVPNREIGGLQPHEVRPESYIGGTKLTALRCPACNYQFCWQCGSGWPICELRCRGSVAGPATTPAPGSTSHNDGDDETHSDHWLYNPDYDLIDYEPAED